MRRRRLLSLARIVLAAAITCSAAFAISASAQPIDLGAGGLSGGKAAAASAPAAVTVSFMQSVDASGSGASLSKALAGNVTAGDLLVAQITAAGGATVSDSLNGAWTRAANDGGVHAIWYLARSKAGADTITVANPSPAAGLAQLEVDGHDATPDREPAPVEECCKQCRLRIGIG